MEKQTMDKNNVQKQTMNAWKMIYCLMDNVKTYMDITMEEKKKFDHITKQDVDKIIDYIHNSLQGIMKNTLEDIKTEQDSQSHNL